MKNMFALHHHRLDALEDDDELPEYVVQQMREERLESERLASEARKKWIEERRASIDDSYFTDAKEPADILEAMVDFAMDQECEVDSFYARTRIQEILAQQPELADSALGKLDLWASSHDYVVLNLKLKVMRAIALSGKDQAEDLVPFIYYLEAKNSTYARDVAKAFPDIKRVANYSDGTFKLSDGPGVLPEIEERRPVLRDALALILLQALPVGRNIKEVAKYTKQVVAADPEKYGLKFLVKYKEQIRECAKQVPWKSDEDDVWKFRSEEKLFLFETMRALFDKIHKHVPASELLIEGHPDRRDIRKFYGKKSDLACKCGS